MNGSARVVLQGREVGDLTFTAGGCVFRYTDDLLDPHHQVLGQVFEEEPRQQFRERVGLPAWFANLLPEQDSGLWRYYAARFGEHHIDNARLLLSLGDDLPGAATVVPIDIPDEGILLDPLGLKLDSDGVHMSALAGVQLKMSVVRDGERLTIPARGERGSWIAKLPGRTYAELAANEFLMMRWAAAAGLDVPAVDLLPAAGVPDIFNEKMNPDSPVYVVERFDRRPDGSRVHIEDLAQATGKIPQERDKGTTYDDIGNLVRSVTGDTNYVEYLRRLVAMVLMGNGDAHLKNWSLRYPDGRTPHLAPAYDLVCTTMYRTLDRRLTFPLGGQTRIEAIGAPEFRKAAGTAGFSADDAVQIARETAANLRDSWPDVRREKLAPDLVAHIDERITTHPLVRI